MKKTWHLFKNDRVSVTVNFDLHDIWIGVYWKVVGYPIISDYQLIFCRDVIVYLCILPMIPIQITISKELA